MKQLLIDDENKLIGKIFLYKTFLYNNVEFKSTLDNEEIQAIIQALNIKSRRNRIEYIYDYCCNKIDNYYQNKNICDFKDRKCMYNRIVGKNVNGCCRNCIYQSDNGCETSNLSCKLFYCDKIKNKNEIIKIKDLKILKLLTVRQRIMIMEGFFASREEQLTDLKIGLFMVHVVRNVYREMRNSIKLRMKNKK